MRQSLTIIGAFVGASVGHPSVGMALGSMVGGLIDPERIKNPSLGDIAQQTSAEGVPCPLYAGTAGGAGNLIYCSEPDVVEGEFGKGGPQQQEPDRIYRTFLIRVGQSLFTGPGVRTSRLRLIKVWELEKLVYDVSPESTILEESAAYADDNALEFYPGDEAQLPDPAVEAIKGVGNVSAYRGRAYLRMRKDCTDSRGAVPPFRFEVAVDAVEEAPIALLTSGDLYAGPVSATTLSAQDPWGAFSVGQGMLAASDDGVWVAAGSSVPPYLRILKRVDGVYVNQTLPVTVPANSVSSVSMSADGAVLGVRISGAQRYLIYRRSGDTFTALAAPSGAAPTNNGFIAVSRDGSKFALSQNTSPGLFHHWIAGDDITEAATAFPFASASYLAYSPDGLALAVTSDLSLFVFDTSTSTDFALVGQKFAVAPGFSSGIRWGRSGAYIVTVDTGFSGGSAVAVFAYDAAGGAARLSDRVLPAVQPPHEPYSVAASRDGDYLAIGMQSRDPGDSALFLYEMDTDGSLAAVASQPPAGVDAAYLAVEFTNAPDVPAIDAATTTQDQLVLATARRCKMAAAQFDVTNLTADVVRGVVISQQGYTGQDFLNGLRWVSLLDGADYDGQIHFPKRGGAVQFALTEDDLVDEQDDGEQEETLRNGDDKRQAPIRRPLKLNLMFPNRTVGYQFTKATSPNYGDRGDAVSEVTLQVPVVLRDTDEAPQLADKLEKTSRADAEAEIVRIVHEGAGARLTPGDVGTLTDRGLTRRVRVETCRSGSGTKRLLLRVDRPHSVTSQISQQAVPAPPAPPPALVGDTQFVVLNLPGIIDADDRLGIRIGAQGAAGTAWYGVRVRLSTDSGETYSDLATIRQRAQLGVLIGEIAAASPHYPDDTNDLRVSMIDDRELETLTEAEWLSEGNGAAIAYADGTAEIVQFRDAQDDGDNEWTLTRLQRGRLATSVDEHGIGAKFVMLEGTVFVPLPSALIGADLVLQFVSLGASNVETAPTFAFTWNPAVAQTEFPPANVLLERDVDDITATVVPRHRFGTEDAPIASANFGRDGYFYRWSATDGANTETADTVAPTWTFDAAGWASPITVTAAALNRYTGAGPSLSEDIA